VNIYKARVNEPQDLFGKGDPFVILKYKGEVICDTDEMHVVVDGRKVSIFAGMTVDQFWAWIFSKTHLLGEEWMTALGCFAAAMNAKYGVGNWSLFRDCASYSSSELVGEFMHRMGVVPSGAMWTKPVDSHGVELPFVAIHGAVAVELGDEIGSEAELLSVVRDVTLAASSVREVLEPLSESTPRRLALIHLTVGHELRDELTHLGGTADGTSIKFHLEGPMAHPTASELGELADAIRQHEPAKTAGPRLGLTKGEYNQAAIRFGTQGEVTAPTYEGCTIRGVIGAADSTPVCIIEKQGGRFPLIANCFKLRPWPKMLDGVRKWGMKHYTLAVIGVTRRRTGTRIETFILCEGFPGESDFRYLAVPHAALFRREALDWGAAQREVPWRDEYA
jgi:hypothetical protein